MSCLVRLGLAPEALSGAGKWGMHAFPHFTVAAESTRILTALRRAKGLRHYMHFDAMRPREQLVAGNNPVFVHIVRGSGERVLKYVRMRIVLDVRERDSGLQIYLKKEVLFLDSTYRTCMW